MPRSMTLSAVILAALAPSLGRCVLDYDFIKEIHVNPTSLVGAWRTTYDWSTSAFAWEKPAAPISHFANSSANWVGPGTAFHTIDATASADCNSWSLSEGTSSVTAGNYNGYAHVEGIHTCNPGADRQARETSKSQLTVDAGNLVRGQIQWKLQGTAKATESSQPSLFDDPMFFDIFDETGQERYRNAFLHVDLTWLLGYGILGSPEGDFDFDNGNMTVTAADASFNISISDPFIVQSGFAHLTVSHGVVSASSDGGIFAGRMPAVGTPIGFTVNIDPGPLDFDLSPLGPNLTTTIGESIEIGATASAVPEPASVLALAAGLAALIRHRRSKH